MFTRSASGNTLKHSADPLAETSASAGPRAENIVQTLFAEIGQRNGKRNLDTLFYRKVMCDVAGYRSLSAECGRAHARRLSDVKHPQYVSMKVQHQMVSTMFVGEGKC